MTTTFAAIVGFTALVAADPTYDVTRHIPYVPRGPLGQRLDVYAPPNAKDAPVVVWIHGGGWKIGDKRGVNEKPAAFTQKDFVLVSINYRLVPKVKVEDQADDVARAIAFVREHVPKKGDDPTKMFLMGHSAGAHLAALVATDATYLEKVDMKPADLAGAILLDGAGYDVPERVRTAGVVGRKLYVDVFGDDAERQRKLSPITHVKPGGEYPPFVILHVADRAESRKQSEALAEKLKAAKTPAKVYAAEDKTHATINRELGLPNDGPTKVVFEFLDGRLEELANSTTSR